MRNPNDPVKFNVPVEEIEEETEAVDTDEEVDDEEVEPVQQPEEPKTTTKKKGAK